MIHFESNHVADDIDVRVLYDDDIVEMLREFDIRERTDLSKKFVGRGVQMRYDHHHVIYKNGV